MNTSIAVKPALYAVGLPALLILATIVIALTPSFINRDPSLLSLAITIDLAISIPILYLSLIWNRNVPRITVAPVFVGGILLATVLVPAEEQGFLTALKEWILPVVETVVITLIVLKLRRLRIAYKGMQRDDFDPLTALREVSRQIIPRRIGQVFATEIALFYYCFVTWRRPKLDVNMFTSHRENGTIALLGALLLAIAIETTALHFLIGRWSVAVAWIFTALSIYATLQVFGMIKSISRRPIVLTAQRLYVRNGLFGNTTIDLADIESVELIPKDAPLDPHRIKKLSPLNHNLLIHLRKENLVEGLYGATKTYSSLAFYVDNSRRFIESLHRAMEGVRSSG